MMKPVVALQIGREAVQVADYRLMLELSACGRGFITAKLDRDCVGELARLDLGINGVVYRWFTGYVERCGPAENGYKRLFVRELVGGFARDLPVSLQHPTLRDVCRAATERTGLEFALPDAGYVDNKIPHFKSAGSGNLLLERLGASFGIEDYCWYQLPDGMIYVGSYAHSRFANLPVEMPEEFAKGGTAGNALEMAFIPAIRPGVIINGKRIVQVEASGETMAIRWSPAGRAGDPPEKRQIDKHYPELAAKMHLPQLARVVGPTDSAALGDQSDRFRPRYAVNVQLIDPDGNDSAAPELVAVPLPVPLAGPEGGIYQYPTEGTVVEIGFAGGRPDRPLIRQTLQDDQPLPDIRPGEQLQQQRAGVSLRATQDGSWQRETDQVIKETSRERVIISDAESRETTARQALIKANDSLTVIGTHTLAAGAVVHVSDGPWSMIASGKITTHGKEREDITDNDVRSTVGGNLTEAINGIRKSVAASHQLLAPSIVIGSEAINLMRLFTDTLDVIEALAKQTAAHTHNNTGVPNNSAAISDTAARPGALRSKYDSFIG